MILFHFDKRPLHLQLQYNILQYLFQDIWDTFTRKLVKPLLWKIREFPIHTIVNSEREHTLNSCMTPSSKPQNNRWSILPPTSIKCKIREFRRDLPTDLSRNKKIGASLFSPSWAQRQLRKQTLWLPTIVQSGPRLQKEFRNLHMPTLGWVICSRLECKVSYVQFQVSFHYHLLLCIQNMHIIKSK